METGFYCSTSGTYFYDKESLTQHYRSDFHRYNLKRKAAGLPPVTQEWFETRKAQLLAKPAQETVDEKVWLDPLTKRKFMTENTYSSFVRSKKYLELVKKSGKPAPEPIITEKPKGETVPVASAPISTGTSDVKIVPPSGGLPMRMYKLAVGDEAAEEDYSGIRKNAPAKKSPVLLVDENDEDDEDSSDWEVIDDEDEEAEITPEEEEEARATSAAAKIKKLRSAASAATAGISKKKVALADGETTVAEEDSDKDDEEEEKDWEDWDVRVSLFDNFRSESLEDNIKYMWLKFGFVIPDSTYLVDPEGLIKYLGAKLRYGRVALYTSGDDEGAKRFSSLHAVQRHMVDTNQCRMLYDDNEEEYEDFYEYEGEEFEAEIAESQAVALVEEAGANLGRGNGYELSVGADESGQGGKILGCREFARYYRQHHRPQEIRASVLVNRIYAQAVTLGANNAAVAAAAAAQSKEVQKFAMRAIRQRQYKEIKMSIITNTLKKLPKNCEY
uniref:ZN622/Rei1/Reh1 zinc finger C2H2-type domain-containing protein n=1 Tax=Polytomella parva TaxID=51329 RepID=A0A7S0UW75_9CHLO|mmetsp:Transcript_24214/g.43372  ORF Transcript_24214/g.43372 Transcript_24214/m.43372 type:complete len:501 (+) Transcript_24214:115-1617(+)|eukprot:CAMPEP_0175051688 /NCGR_PEP_ID=MMETSP0052_2-20121109/7947_1 /TAXON_ID=51329 ORGANISM="Polytomella parva, Strain SAG 63-3" /NCGR_SAMPLE_ID=MMETSP0052_2 /ASSEMBLY_ACC=CAM_ASM_000194 /LENGTH=500 /DNA_ID=CAMNT_0016316017 /DNA_START=109 /DNA_END=1611 /DNA_ORIENTATION=+